jgi:adenine deaminase
MKDQRCDAGEAAAGDDFHGALRSVEIFGVADRFGTLAPGRPADLVMWSGDPLEVSSVADLVVVDGQVQSGVSRHTLLRDRYLERVQRGEAR